MRAIGLVIGIAGVAALCFFAGCGDDESPRDTSAPTVIATDPIEGATGISPYPVVQVWFSEEMDPATIDTLTFYIEGLRGYSVLYDATEHKATLYPAVLAEAGTEYDVHVAGEVEDASGNAMGQEAVFAFTTGERDCEHLGDRFEPNDVIASATPVEVDVVYPGLTSCGGAERDDYYRISLSESKKIVVMADVSYADTAHVSWKINFRREDGKDYSTLGTGVDSTGGVETYHYTFLPGTYWIEVGNYYESSHLVLYHLTVAGLDPVEDDQYEDNDFFDEAKPIEPGLHEGLRGAHVDDDYFSIDLAVGQTLTITVTEVPAITDTRRVRIARPTGSTLAGGNYQTGPVAVSWTATQAGEHLIDVQWWTDGIIYNLNVEVTP